MAQGVADVVLGRRQDEAEHTARGELPADLEKEFPRIVAVDLGGGRLGQVQEDRIIAVQGALEEGPAVAGDDADPGIDERRPHRPGQVLEGHPDHGRVELHAIDADLGVLQGFGGAAADPSADEEDAARALPLQQREVDRLLGGPLVGMREDGQSVVEERELFLGPDDLQLAVEGIPGRDQAQGLPSRFLGRSVEAGQRRGRNDDPGQERFPAARLHGQKDGNGGRPPDQGRALPIREAGDEHEVDQEAGRGRAGGFQDVDRGDVPPVKAGVQHEGAAEREAQDEAQQESRAERGREPGQLGRQNVQELMGEPQAGQADEEKADGQAVEPGQSGNSGRPASARA